MMPAISLEQHNIIQQVLRAYLPIATKVWIFGSRAVGNFRPFSDLDLLLKWGKKLLPEQSLLLAAEAFDNSALPYKVDLVDWHRISFDFRKHILSHCIAWDDLNTN